VVITADDFTIRGGGRALQARIGGTWAIFPSVGRPLPGRLLAASRVP
jgi:hypothetical protein